MSDPRRLALRFLLEVEQGRHIDLLTSSPSFSGLSAADRGLAFELVYGCTRQLRRLDHDLARHSSRPLARLDPAVRWLLRMGAYQIAFLRVPEHAAVDTSVRLCRQEGLSSASAFVNAVLRNLIRFPAAPPEGSDADSLGIRHSHPTWLVERYLRRWGLETSRRILEQNNRPPAAHFWVNPRRGSPEMLLEELKREGLEGRRHGTLKRALQVPANAVARLNEWKDWGFFMDEGSQRVAEGRIPPGSRRLGDLCAAPGGKTFLLEADCPRDGLLVSCDISRRRLQQIRQRSVLLQIPDLHLLQCDSCRPPFRSGGFDFLLLDVPCSGLGTIRSNPDIRWRVEQADLSGFQERQCNLLRAALDLLRVGGRLVYSTCSTEPEENEEVLRRALDPSQPAEILDLGCNFPGEASGDSFFWAELGTISTPRGDTTSVGSV